MGEVAGASLFSPRAVAQGNDTYAAQLGHNCTALSGERD